ncbi:MAG TPA: choice-of-anchor tandem repeat GloVer-containing protein, partial [Rhizomicrobium sp.]|nr:choice-of-anchor tandem repeat GloVer-containing protein [Rhizomicrobium sp.]
MLVPVANARIIYMFKGGNDGAAPEAGLIADSAGNLYGTTMEGGGAECSGYGCGTVFRLSPDNTETVLYAFRGGSDGALPMADLVRDAAGNLYGTTYEGGGNGCQQGLGCGTVFKLAPDGTETILYSFKGGGSDGAYPEAGVVQDSVGNLYGTTVSGGLICVYNQNCGTVFKIAPDGTETVLHFFRGESNGKLDGAFPEADLIIDKTGNLYGTTTEGGLGAPGGAGTVFRVTLKGTEKIIYYFGKGSFFDSAEPNAGLVSDKTGNLYGTTISGGQGEHTRGTVFEV